MTRKTSTLIGAGAGLALYLFAGLLPSMYYGGFAGVLLAGGIFGTPLQPTVLVRGLIYFSTAMGVVGVGSLFAVGGAAAARATSMPRGCRGSRRTLLKLGRTCRTHLSPGRPCPWRDRSPGRPSPPWLRREGRRGR